MQAAIELTAASVSMIARPLSAIALAWQSVVTPRLHPYRPEEHYMRGPGPKWHAKRLRELQMSRAGLATKN
jgi:hypothetical protein